MLQVSKKAGKVLDRLVELHDKEVAAGKSYLKLANSTVYTPLVVECIGSSEDRTHWSLAHYGELNGDAMRDPEMTFLRRPEDGKWFALSFQNDYAGAYKEYPEDVIQAPDEFVDVWTRNIAHQQGI